MIAKENKK